MIKKLVSRLNESMKGYLSPTRRKICVPLTISIDPEFSSVRRQDTGRLVMNEKLPTIKGETEDLSENGVAFIVSSVRLGDHYLVGEGKTLNITLDLPSGKVQLQAIAQRHKPLGKDAVITKFIIGAQILKMSAADREAYEEYIRYGHKQQKGKKLTLGITNN